MAVSVAGSKAASLSWSFVVLPRRKPNLALEEKPWWEKKKLNTNQQLWIYYIGFHAQNHQSKLDWIYVILCAMCKQDVSCWQKLWLRTNVIHMIQLERALMEQEGCCRDQICDHRTDFKPVNYWQNPSFEKPFILNICRLQFSTL